MSKSCTYESEVDCTNRKRCGSCGFNPIVAPQRQYAIESNWFHEGEGGLMHLDLLDGLPVKP